MVHYNCTTTPSAKIGLRKPPPPPHQPLLSLEGFWVFSSELSYSNIVSISLTNIISLKFMLQHLEILVWFTNFRVYKLVGFFSVDYKFQGILMKTKCYHIAFFMDYELLYLWITNQYGTNKILMKRQLLACGRLMDHSLYIDNCSMTS